MSVRDYQPERTVFLHSLIYANSRRSRSCYIDLTESPQPTEEQRRISRNEEVRAAIEQNLLQLQSAFAQLDVCRNEEAERLSELQKAEAEETQILKNEDLSLANATKRLLWKLVRKKTF